MSPQEEFIWNFQNETQKEVWRRGKGLKRDKEEEREGEVKLKKIHDTIVWLEYYAILEFKRGRGKKIEFGKFKYSIFKYEYIRLYVSFPSFLSNALFESFKILVSNIPTVGIHRYYT